MPHDTIVRERRTVLNRNLESINRKPEMKTFLQSLFIILLIFSSCSKDDPGKIVTAGIYDSDFIYHEFSPPLKVKLILDPLTDNYFWKDSIDINQDGSFDLIINQRIHLPAETGTPTWEHFPYLRLILKNGIQVATKLEAYPVGMGTYNQSYWVDPLNYETFINSKLVWSESDGIRSMWAVPPKGTISTAPSGAWYYLTNEEKYIGIKMKIGSRFKYGWIKVKVISPEDIQFLNYAIEK